MLPLYFPGISAKTAAPAHPVVTLGIWGPIKFYRIPEIWRAVRHPGLHEKARALLQVVSTSDRFRESWLLVLFLPAIIFYNAISAIYPKNTSLKNVLYSAYFVATCICGVGLLIWFYMVLRFLEKMLESKSIIVLISKFLRRFVSEPKAVRAVNIYLNIIRGYYLSNTRVARGAMDLGVLAPVFSAIGIFILFIGLPLLFLAFDVDLLPQAKSDILIVNAFLAASFALFGVFVGLSREKQWPVIPVLVIIMMGLSFSDWDDNHRIRQTTSLTSIMGTAIPKLPKLDQAFTEWMASRKDVNQFPVGHYPVYIVAAQGGGIYAAYQAGMFLSAIQDKYKHFQDHIFAISAVSGGSLGASAFSSLTRVPENPRENNEHWYWNKAQIFLEQDFLSGVTSAALFFDGPARLLPCWDFFCPGERLSRARALERSIEMAWESVFPSGEVLNPFEADIRRFWDPKKNSPALLLNTTEVETGERVVVAPLSLADDSTPGLASFEDRAPKLRIALSTAVSLSARFPWLTPAGSYQAQTERGTEKTEKRRLVDGGYSDNSGVATAIDVISRLRCSPTTGPDCTPTARFILIALVGPPSDSFAESRRYSFNEFFTPLRALDSTRSERGRLAVEQAQLYLDRQRCPDAAPDCGLKGSMRELFLAPGNVRVPLGWVLSEHSRAAIECSLGEPELCHDIGDATGAEKYRRHNRELITEIGKELEPPQ